VPLAQFRRSFTGVVLVFEPGEGFQQEVPASRSSRRHFRQLLTRPGLLAEIAITSVLIQLLALSVPLLTGALVDRVVPRSDYHLLWLLGIGLGAMVLFHFLSTLVRGHLLVHLRTLMDRQMTPGFMAHLVRLPYAFFQVRPAGDLILRASSNAMVREVLTSGALSAFLDGTLACIYLALILTANLRMGLLAAGLGLLQVAVLAMARRRYQELTAEGLSAQARSQSFLVQMLGGMETLKSGGAEGRALTTWSSLFAQELSASLTRGRLTASTDALFAALRTISPLIMLFAGGTLVLGHQMTLGTMLALQAMSGGFLTPLSSLVNTTLQLQTVRSHLDRLNDVLDSPPEQPVQRPAPAGPLRGEITLDRVSFQYGPFTPPTVQDVTLTIRPGQFVAIVGRSGSGKSTLGKLLLGLYQPASGTIRYDGADLAELDLGTVRAQVGVVPQNPFLFGTSIRANITLSDPAIGMDEVVRAAGLAQIHEDILQMPLGYDSPLNDSGNSLSGGQRQRVALARALVHRPAVLLLDEATSALDTVTERRVQEALDSLRCTRVVITQRLSTIRQADLIVVMESGRVVEKGTHEELLHSGKLYAELVHAQQL
jgi:ATP-binding cassette subfamily B protein